MNITARSVVSATFRWFLLGLVCLSALAPLSGQAPNSTAAARQLAADTAWTNVTALTKTAGNSARSAAPATPAVAKTERESRAQKYRQVAAAAKDFAAQYPEHGKAGESRKVEALAGLEGIIVDDNVQETAAVATAAAFRTNKTNPAPARYEVALALDGRAISKKILGRPWHAHAPMAEDMLDKLRVEFGDRPEIYGGYLALAENADCDNGRDVALKIVQSPAPAWAKIAARRLLDRYALVRKPLDFPLTTTQGRATTLAKEAGKLTVVVFYDGKTSPAGPAGLHDYQKNPAPNTRWVYVALGTPPPLAKGAKPLVVPPGTNCVEPLARKSPLHAQLKLTQLPAVFVLDEAKKLSAYGRIDQLPWLMSSTGRPVLP